MTNEEMTIRFKEMDERQANAHAEALLSRLKRKEPSLVAKQASENPKTMDFGSTLILILGTAPIIAIAKGIADYIRGLPTGVVEISANGRTTTVRAASADMAEIVAAIEGHTKS